MQLIRKYNKGTRFLLCVIDIFSKYEWDIFLKDKKVQLFLIVNNSKKRLTKYGSIKVVDSITSILKNG